jgi:CheY-like chemotaxis protein
LVQARLDRAAAGLNLLRQQAAAGADVGQAIILVEKEIELLRQQFAAVRAAESGPAGPARKALLVEDDGNQRELLAGLLRLSGFAVDTAGDGCDALDHLACRGRPDVVLLDMGLPRCDGVTTARRIRRDPALAGLRIFAVSGHTPEEYGLDREPQLIDRWFCKPLDPNALLQELALELYPA